MLELWTARSQLKGYGGSKGKNKNKNTMDAHNLDSTRPANNEPEMELGGFDMSDFKVDAVEVRESDWIKFGF